MDLSDGKRMFGDIKSKLGFKGKADAPAYDEYYDDGYDDYGDGYDDYADDGYDSSYDGGGSSSRYDSYGGSVTTRRSSARSSSSSLPRLVSIDDVRANTQVPSSLTRDPLPARHVTRASSASSSYRSTRTMVDSSLPPEMTPEGTAATAAAASRRHSDGLDSLFSSTAEEPGRLSVDGGLHARPSSSASGASARGSYDPYDALSGSTGSSYSAKRSVVVLRPADYGEAEQVARALKAGDVAVLCLGATPDALAKRILDFSFGVAAALDASVECVADKTFAITRFKELSDSERVGLHAQGVL
ncbi:cell division protein SepF [Adlercreutzia faecimuris]|uniref:Cell division protein SepF n=1 Tax=Adlercreutzia faecimuris TaxID=2897341 RepID=A0ABS9WFW1_9ACTN|nr:cell division protein SepF [Adlercreutzia sp. JBNU-10]MCI2241748.1 cell division protein SepF [Adlercreutzia sp. JBNU-10]